MKRSLLIISYFFSPMISARAFRWSALARYWAAQDYRVDVIAGYERGFAREEQIDGVQVYRVNHWLVERLTSGRASASDSADQVDTAGPKAGIKRWPGQAFRKLYRSLYWPDAGFLWYFSALQQAKTLLAHHHYDALITVSPFFTAHLIGKQLRSDFGNLPWMVDCGDPYSFQEIEPHYNRVLYRRLSRRAEREVFHEADTISVTTRATADIYKEQFPESAGKVHVIPPLLSLPEKSISTERIFQDDGKIRLCFTGALYSDTRSPDYLLALFAGLIHQPDLMDTVELHFWGDVNRVIDTFKTYQYLLDSGKIVLHGVTSREVVAQAMHEASILVNIGNKTPYQLPSKVVEYGSTGEPILNLIQIENDSSLNILDRYPVSLTLCDMGTAALADQIEQLARWVLNLPPPVDPEILQGWLEDFRLENIAAKYEDHLWSQA